MVHVTEAAQLELERIMNHEGKGNRGVRLGVKGGGCSGFTYVMSFVNEGKDNDSVFNEERTPIYVDPKSMV